MPRLRGVEKQKLVSRSRVFFVAFVLAAAVALMAHPVLAQVEAPTEELAQLFNLPAVADLRLAIIRVVSYLLGFLGLLAVIVMMYGGFLWMTARGNEQQVEHAKTVLKNGLIGLIIILMSWAIVAAFYWFFVRGLTGDGDGGGCPGCPPPPTCLACDALGGGIIQDHYPERDQGIRRGDPVPRNVSVFITFREEILVLPNGDANEDGDSFIKDAVQTGGSINFTDSNGNPQTFNCDAPLLWCGWLNPAIFTLKWTDPPAPVPDTPALVMTNDERTFYIRPIIYLGSAEADSIYEATVYKKPLVDTPGLTKKTGTSGLTTNDYVWKFKVSTELDLTPPRVTRIRPVDADTVPRNYVIMMTFDDVINPLSSTGNANDADNNGQIDGGSFTNIIVKNTSDNRELAGRFRIGNGYQTVYFLTNDFCGTNSCGEDMFCLPGEKDIEVTIKAAASANDPLNPSRGNFLTGVVDKADNSLDGERKDGCAVGSTACIPVPSGDGKAEFQPTDNFVWTFNTSSAIINTGPIILTEFVEDSLTKAGVQPEPDIASVGLTDPARARFNRDMIPFSGFPDPGNDPSCQTNWTSSCKVISDVKLYGIDTSVVPPNYTPYSPWWVRQKGVDMCSESTTTSCTRNADCLAVSGRDDDLCGQGDVFINHDEFINSEEYEPRIANQVQDITQNCYNPAIGPVGPAYPNSSYIQQPPADWNNLNIYSDPDPARLH